MRLFRRFDGNCIHQSYDNVHRINKRLSRISRITGDALHQKCANGVALNDHRAHCARIKSNFSYHHPPFIYTYVFYISLASSGLPCIPCRRRLFGRVVWCGIRFAFDALSVKFTQIRINFGFAAAKRAIINFDICTNAHILPPFHEPPHYHVVNAFAVNVYRRVIFRPLRFVFWFVV